MLLLHSSIPFSLFCGIIVIHITSINNAKATIQITNLYNFMSFKEAERKENELIFIAFIILTFL